MDENVARKIIRMFSPHSEDVILEVGAGFGALTKYLIHEVKEVIAVEIDRHLCQKLNADFSAQNHFKLIQGDVLKLNLADFLSKSNRSRVLGNIPYHITSPLIFKVFAARRDVLDMTLMIQKEVAQRIVARTHSKNYGILSVYSQLYSKPRILFHVSRNVFKPRPEVDSSVVQWDFSQASALPIVNQALLDSLIHAVFQHRRKMLRKSLQKLPQFSAKRLYLNLDLERRPEELSPLEFVDLSNQLS